MVEPQFFPSFFSVHSMKQNFSSSSPVQVSSGQLAVNVLMCDDVIKWCGDGNNLQDAVMLMATTSPLSCGPQPSLSRAVQRTSYIVPADFLVLHVFSRIHAIIMRYTVVLL